jgi:hypothetical protein
MSFLGLTLDPFADFHVISLSSFPADLLRESSFAYLTEAVRKERSFFSMKRERNEKENIINSKTSSLILSPKELSSSSDSPLFWMLLFFVFSLKLHLLHNRQSRLMMMQLRVTQD